MVEDKYNFIRLIETQKNQNIAKEENFKRSRANLKNLIEKRMKTVMVGSLASFEEKFEQFWKPEPGQKMTKEQELLQKLFQEVRSSILDKGNNQIRLLEKDLENFNVEAKKYHLQFKVDQQ